MTVIALAAWLYALPLPALVAVSFVATVIGFSALYLGAAWSIETIARALVGRGVASPISSRAPPRRQRGAELRAATGAILAFSAWTPVLFLGWRLGMVTIGLDASPARVALECIASLLWGELHFYAMHRLLHTRLLYRRVHALHHRFTVPTPFSAFAMHPVEGFMLGSVLPLAAMAVSLSAWTLILFPAIHFAFNAAGHSGVRISRTGGMAARHAEHHRVSGSRRVVHIGFLSSLLDRMAGSAPQESRARHKYQDAIVR